MKVQYRLVVTRGHARQLGDQIFCLLNLDASPVSWGPTQRRYVGAWLYLVVFVDRLVFRQSLYLPDGCTCSAYEA